MTNCNDADHQEKTKGGRDGMRSAAKKYGTEIYILSLVWEVREKGEGERMGMSVEESMGGGKSVRTERRY